MKNIEMSGKLSFLFFEKVFHTTAKNVIIRILEKMKNIFQFSMYVLHFHR